MVVEVMGGAFQHWCLWITSAGTHFYNHGKQALVAYKNAHLMVATTLKKCFAVEDFLYQILLSCSLFLL